VTASAVLDRLLPPGPAYHPAVDTGSRLAEEALLVSLRAGDEAAFLDLVRRHHPAMVRVARAHVPSQAVAEEVAQETWLAVLNGLDRFEGRSTLKTWMFRILVNRARTRGRRERRSVPFASLGPAEEGLDPERFQGEGDPFPGHWAAPPAGWEGVPEERLLSSEALALVRSAIDALPPSQREVITLRDVQGWTSEEACAALGVTPGNQRVLLHRARSAVRAALERYLEAGP